jgi:hypothetical protein
MLFRNRRKDQRMAKECGLAMTHAKLAIAKLAITKP